MAVCAALFLCFIIWLGYPFGNFAFGLLLSVHASGFIYYCSPYLLGKPFSERIIFTVLALLGIGLMLYMPARHVLQNHWLMPLRANGNVFVVQRIFPAQSVKRGDWVAYKLEGHIFTNHGFEGHYGRNGAGFGPVLAMAGDTVTFSTNAFFVNEVSQPLLPYMPTSGTLTVAENQWFIWPSYSISGRGDGNRIADLMMSAAMVSKDQFIGKPFNRWFWRKQILP